MNSSNNAFNLQQAACDSAIKKATWRFIPLLALAYFLII